MPDSGNLLEAQLSCQNHPAGAQVKPGLGAFVVSDGLLGGDVPLAVGSVLSRQGKGSQVCQNQGVHPCIVQLLQILGKACHLVIAGHGVHGDVTLDMVAVGEFHRLYKLLRGEIARKGAHTKAGACQIYGIGSVENGHLEPFHVTGGAEKL